MVLVNGEHSKFSINPVLKVATAIDYFFFFLILSVDS